METTQATASQTFSKFVTSLDLSDIPTSAQHRAKLHLLDTLGAGIAGSASLEAEVSRLALAPTGQVAQGGSGVPLGVPPRPPPAAGSLHQRHSSPCIRAG